MCADWIEHAKRRAAIEAVKNIKDGFIVGLGSGSTAAYAIEEIGRRVKEEGLRVLGIPTSHQALILAIRNGIPITTLHEHPVIDLTIDGADQIDPNLNLIKGMGGALTREKIIASASKNFIIVADERKLVNKLGGAQPLPIEILPFAQPLVTSKIMELGGKPRLRRVENMPYITDNGNFILDVDFGVIENPAELNYRLKVIPGVIETGLFIGMAHMAYVGTRNGVKKITI
ncbi:ribose 5-phosphate isomerase A [Candidatus Bathyarchaeota archaeon]|nr:ribose 5-phosphate isomerase A [Candidatus Bathyarchaeota archaeon]